MPNDAVANDDAEIARISEASRAIRPLRHSRLREAAQALNANRPDVAGQVLSEFLKAYPRDADALNLMADAALRLERKIDAEEWLARCVAEAPDFDAAKDDAMQVPGHPVGAAEDHRSVQANREVGRSTRRERRAAEEGHEVTGHFRVLIDQDAEHAARAQEAEHLAGRQG